MSDMYEKLGDLLNDVLESGKIPENNEKKDQEIKKEAENASKTGPFSFNKEKITEKTNQNKANTRRIKHNTSFTEEIPVGKVYKDASFSDYEYSELHKYAEKMHIPKEVSDSLDTLHIVSLCDWKKIKKAYHQALKKAHPDTKEKMPGEVQHYTVEQVISAYNILKNYYKHK